MSMYSLLLRLNDIFSRSDAGKEAIGPYWGAVTGCLSASRRCNQAFQYEASRLGNYDWPNEVFDAYGSEAGNLEDEE